MLTLKRLFVVGILLLAGLPQVGAAEDSATPTILVLGDSLSAAYGIAPQDGWVALLQAQLSAQDYPHRVVNKSISGETTAGGLARLPEALAQTRPVLTLIELGANDGLRAQPLAAMRERLGQMISLARQAGSTVALFEMRIPANYGARYAQAFHASFAAVAQEHNAVLVPFFLQQIALDPNAFQDDGIHPTAAVQTTLLNAVWPSIKPLLAPVRSAR